MHRKQSILFISRILAAVAITLLLAASGWSQTGTILYNFTGGHDGGTPESRPVFDANGNLYGTTQAGGASGNGTVFMLTPNGGQWTEAVLHSFAGGADGWMPSAGVIFDHAGNLYGTVAYGGNFGQGGVFELSPDGRGGWTNTMIYSFTGANDGRQPVSEMTLDNHGNLYSVTNGGGTYSQGVVFELSPNGQGGWTETVLYSFQGGANDCATPSGAVVFDIVGNLYGVAVANGPANKGCVYQLTPNGQGNWTETVLHFFLGGASDGATPARSSLLVGHACATCAAGVLYGTTTNGGSADDGTVFALFRTPGGWMFNMLYAFPGGANGKNPYAGLVEDSSNNLYGTTSGGVFRQGGVVFQLSPGPSILGGWRETVLYTFDGAGNGSYAPLTRDNAGNLFGTTGFGGPQSAGNVFEVNFGSH